MLEEFRSSDVGDEELSEEELSEGFSEVLLLLLLLLVELLLLASFREANTGPLVNLSFALGAVPFSSREDVSLLLS